MVANDTDHTGGLDTEFIRVYFSQFEAEAGEPIFYQRFKRVNPFRRVYWGIGTVAADRSYPKRIIVQELYARASGVIHGGHRRTVPCARVGFFFAGARIQSAGDHNFIDIWFDVELNDR